MEPETLQNSKIKSAPKLRFNEYTKDWDSEKLKNVIKIKSGLGFKAKEYSENGVRLLQIENVSYGNIKWTKNVSYLPDRYLKKFPELHLKQGDIVIALNRPVTNDKLKISKIGLFDEPSILYQRVGKICLINKNLSSEFLYQLFILKIKEFVLKKSIGSDQPFISITSLYKLKIGFPEGKEQLKIASFLYTIDNKIQQLTRKKELLESYKKGVMQQLFSQDIRFKNEDGKEFPEWDEKKLGEIADRITLKNVEDKINFVLTNSATQGIISQNDYFDRDIANQNNLQGYYVVSKNDFVYNPRISVHAPVGPIKRNKLKKGVMSPLYSVFRFKEDKNLVFFEYYFETVEWHKYLNSVANFGARHDRMNIGLNDFYLMPLPYPCANERQKIADFLFAIDKKIEAVSQEIIKTKSFKKGLLQQMFV